MVSRVVMSFFIRCFSFDMGLFRPANRSNALRGAHYLQFLGQPLVDWMSWSGRESRPPPVNRDEMSFHHAALEVNHDLFIYSELLMEGRLTRLTWTAV